MFAQKTQQQSCHFESGRVHIALASAPDSLKADRPFAAATLRRSPDATADRRPQEPSRRMPYSRKTSAMTWHASLSLVRKCTVCGENTSPLQVLRLNIGAMRNLFN
ncbi:hypothetical protein AJ87_22700 [Rhizobium yanglingense]|nr:hypothetical protein AJ87_22700 [Rhizobium yanglingense]